MVLKYLFIYIVVMTLAIIATRFFPWWAAFIIIPGAVALLIAYTTWRIKRFFRKAMAIGIERMGWPLLGATVVVHSVAHADRPEGITDEDLADKYGEDDDDDEIDNRPVRFVAVDMTITPANDLPPPIGMEDFDEIPGDWRVWQPSHFLLVNNDDPGQQPGRGMLELLSITAASVLFVEHLSDDGSEIIGACSPNDVDENGVPYDDPDAYEELEDDIRDGSSKKHDDVVDQVGDQTIVRTTEMPYSPNRGTEARRVRLVFGIPAALTSPAKLRYANHDFSLIDLPPS